MIDVKHIICAENNCETRANYNIEGEKKPLYCVKHKLKNMIDVVNNCCIEKGCITRPSYNIEGKKKAYIVYHIKKKI